MWTRRRRPPRRVTLYGKPGCHLCEEALALLHTVRGRYPMEITEVDITRDAALYRAYDIRIPVIVIDGELELEAPIEEAVLRRALRG